MRIGFRVWSTIAALVLSLALVGCGGGGGSNLPDPIIRFINSSPDSNPLDFYKDATKEASALAYLSSSADLTIHTFDTTNGNALSVQDSTNPALGQLDSIIFTFARNQKYLGLTVGLENYGAENLKRLQLLAFQYNKTS